MLRALRFCAVAIVMVGCSCEDPVDVDAGFDSGSIEEAGTIDAGVDTGTVDAGFDAGGPSCGNSVIEPPEVCDDGNVTTGDGCDDACALEVAPGCGNGVREIGEGCDDMNTADDDACLSSCALASCGDAIVRTDLATTDPGFEACDDGNRSDADGCLDGTTGTCAVATCGDSVVRRDLTMGQAGYEECDDGNTAAGDGCDATCQIEGSCGDGSVGLGEMCDLGSANDDEASGACPTVCRRNCRCPSCGDGVTDFAAGEQCDDGGTTAGDGCDATCHIERPASCGDGTLDIAAGEECDDGGTAIGDGCDGSCQLEPVGATCGDSTVDPLEVCDPPEAMPADGDGCNATCNLSGTVTTLATGVDTLAIASDGTSLYLAIGGCGPTAPACGVARIDIAACTAAPGTAACQPTTFVGGGTGLCACGGAPADGTLATGTYSPIGSMATDGTTIWLANQHTIRELDIATGAVTTVAGRTGSCAAIDGVGTNAYFHDIRGMTYWNGSVYLLDGCENVLRRYDPRARAVVTIGGTRAPDPAVAQTAPYTCPANFTCSSGTPAPGYGTNAVYGSPRYMTADNAGNLYFVDTNGQAIWRYNTVTTYSEILISGSAPGVTTGAYTDGTAAMTNIGRPRGITSDGTSVYFNEQNYATIRQLELSTMTTSTFVGAEGCAANDTTATSPAARDGLGADTTRLWCRGGGGGAPPATVPIFNTMLGAITFDYAHSSLFLVDDDQASGGTLRRIQ